MIAPAALAAIVTRTAALGFSMASEPAAGAMLRMLAATKPGGRLLELGTGTGLSTAWLLDGMDARAALVTVDNDPDVQAVARDALGADRRLTIVTDDAGSFLCRQDTIGYDLIFADAMAGKYEYLNKALALLRPGGIYIVDDMLPRDDWPADHARKVPALIAEIAQRPGFHSVNVAWSSGLMLVARQA